MKFDNYKIETYIPEDIFLVLKEELNDIGALTIDGKYDNCITTSKVISYWRPLENTNPYLGKIGEISKEEELKVEFCCVGSLLVDVVDIIKKIHPYETPVINIIPIVSLKFYEKE